MSEKMTIHKGLAELKIIDSRISKGIAGMKAVGLRQKDKLVDQLYEVDQYEKDVKSDYQSVNDLILRKNKIKSAIVKANGETMVEIGDKTMSIADAISFRAIVDQKRSLLDSLRAQFSDRTAEMNKYNETIDANALNLAEAALGKEKSGSDDANAIIEPYKEANKLEMIDPLNVEELIDKLQDEIDEFDMEIDATLSEINAITFIEI